MRDTGTRSHTRPGSARRRAAAWLSWLVGLLVLIGLACNMQQPTPTPVPPTPTPDFCRSLVGIPEVPRPANTFEYEGAIASFLTEGGAPPALDHMLRDWGVITDRWGTVNAANDLNRDGLLDVVVTLQYPVTTTELQPPGQLLVFGCDTSGGTPTYRTLYGQATAPGTTTSMPQIIKLGDMTGDAQPEMAFYIERCTTLACFREPYILTWDASRSGFRSMNNGFTTYYHYRDSQGQIVPGFPLAGFEVSDQTGDGPQEFIVREGHITLREAGPHRPATYIFTWNGTEYTDPVVLYSPSGYLIHALRDADRLLKGGDLAEAMRQYYAALHDNEPIDPDRNDGDPSNDDKRYPELIPWGGIYPKQETMEAEEAMLDAYAEYRLILAHTANRDGQAQTLLQAMQQSLPWGLNNVPSYYTRLAEVFVSTFLAAPAGVDPLGTACIQVKTYAAREMQATYEFLGNADYFGPALSNYTVDDLCPF